MTGEAPSIEVRDLRKDFRGTKVLDGIELVVQPGTVFGYIGPNGAGKTTTVKILTGLLGGFRGKALVAGIDVRLEPREVKRRIGYVPENAILYEALTVAELLRFVGRLHDLEEGILRRRTEEMLEAFDLTARADSRIATLSKGMRQKVLLLSALLHDPPVLFLDEPLSGLDVASAMFVKDLLRGLAARGRAIFFCSHVMDVVERLCDRIAILDRGRIVANGTYGELSEAGKRGSLERVFAELTRREELPDDARRVARILAVLGDGLDGK